MRGPSAAFVVIVLIGAGPLAACGQKGPLLLAKPAPPAPAATASAPSVP